MRMPLVISLAVGLAIPAQAQELCYKQYHVWQTLSDARVCRFNRVFDTWLEAHGIKTEPILATYERIDGIGTTYDDPIFFGPLFFKPKAYVEVRYTLSKSETLRVLGVLQYRPEYFDDLENELDQASKAILCSTIDRGDGDFVRAGGAISYVVTLAPGVLKQGMPMHFAQVYIEQASCEAP